MSFLLLVLLSCRLSFGDSGSWLYLDGNNDRTASSTGVALDSDGVIWVSDGSNFLCKYANLAFSQVPLPAAFPYNRVLSLYPSRTKGIFAMLPGSTGRECRLVKCFDGGPQVIFENGANGDSFFEDSKGRIWSSDYDGSILLYKEKKAYKIKYNSGFPENVNRNMQGESVKNKVYNPVDFLEDSSGRIWAWTNIKKGENYQLSMCELLCFDGEQVYSFPLDGLPNKQLCSIMEVKPGTFWIGTYNAKGIWVYECAKDEKGKPQLKSLRYSPDNFHESFLLEHFKDSSGRIWFVTQDGWESYGPGRNYQSLWRLSGEKTELIKKGLDESPGVYKSGGKRSFCEDKEGNLWVGTAGIGALVVLKSGEAREVSWVNGLRTWFLGPILKDGKDNLFFFPNEAYGRFAPQVLKAGGLDYILGLNDRSPLKFLRLGSKVLLDSKGYLYYVDADGQFVKFDGSSSAAILDIKKTRETLAQKSNNSSQALSYFVLDSKDRVWLYFDRMVVILEDGKPRELTLDDAYTEIALKETEEFRLGSGDSGREYSAPVISKKRELFYQHWWGGRTIRVFNGKEWTDYKVSPDIFKAKSSGSDFFEALFINNDGEAVVNRRSSGSDPGKSFVFRDGGWLESDKYFQNIREKNKNKAALKYTREYNLFNPAFDFKDSRGWIWAVDEEGKIWRSKNRKEESAILPGGRNYYGADAIFEDRKGNLWVSYPNNRYAVLDTSSLEKGPDSASIRALSFGGQNVVIPESAEKIAEPVTDSRVEFMFDPKEIQIFTVKYEYRLDGAGWREESPGKNIKLEGLGFGDHFLEFRVKGNGGAGSTGKLRFTVKYDLTEKLKGYFEKLNKGTPEQQKEAMDELLRQDGAALGFLENKRKETEDETLKWKIDAIISRLK